MPTEKVVKVAKKMMTLNQKWYLTFMIVSGLNALYSVYDWYSDGVYEKQQIELVKLKDEQILKLTRDKIESLARDFTGKEILDQLPVSIWYGKKVGDTVYIKYLNRTAVKQFLTDRGLDQYYYFNRSNFDVFDKKEAKRFNAEHMMVAYAPKDSIYVFDEPFRDAATHTVIRTPYSRWRQIRFDERDTLLWGMMRDPYIETKEKL